MVRTSKRSGAAPPKGFTNEDRLNPPGLRSGVSRFARWALESRHSVGVQSPPDCLFPTRVNLRMKTVATSIPGYTYGATDIPASPVSLQDLERLKISAGFTDEDAQFLRLAGEVLSDQTEKIVVHWRSGIIAGIPHLARHSRSPEGDPLPHYLANSNLRFRQWILDTCLRPYDQDWINYQQEIALRHTSAKKNRVDDVRSTPYVPLRDVLAFIAVINETIKPYLAAKGHTAAEVDKMHLAWCKSMQLQMALWIGPYTATGQVPSEW
jgi:Protoglobin